MLLLDEPSRGVDIEARGEIHRLIRDLAADGLSVIVVSSEAEELPGLCHRVLVMADGAIVAEFGGATVNVGTAGMLHKDSVEIDELKHPIRIL